MVNFHARAAGEWGEHNITVNAIAPGFFLSKMTRGSLEKLGVDKLTEKSPCIASATRKT